ncbi:hypothetical protein REPUB_Repub02eG0217800 [Reevesia pubescens]
MARRVTFAFVRFRLRSELDKAIRFGDNRMMDGRRIRVNETRFGKPNARGVSLDPSLYRGKVVNQVPRVFPISAGTVKNGLSYRDVVVGKSLEGFLPQATEPLPCCEKGTSDDRSQKLAKEVSYDLDVPRSEMQWLSGCAVGRINSSFNLSAIQDTFEEYNINCSMSFMDGISVALLFPSFVELDIHKARFDLARLLVLVESKVRIPSSVSINLNMKVFKIYTFIEDVTLDSLGDGDGSSDDPTDEDEVGCSEETCMACTNVLLVPRVFERYKSYVGREEELLLVYQEFLDTQAARVDLVLEELVGGHDFYLTSSELAVLLKGNDFVPFYSEDNGFLPVGSRSPFWGKCACVSSNPGGAVSSGYGTNKWSNLVSPEGVLAFGPVPNVVVGLVWDSPTLGSVQEGISLGGFLLVVLSGYRPPSPGPSNVVEKIDMVGLPLKPLLRANLRE